MDAGISDLSAGAYLRILFVTYDGPQVTYLESLFLPIFAGLRHQGAEFDVLQFGWGDAAAEERSRSACRRLGIGYRRVRVWRRGGGAGAFASTILGARHVRSAARAFGSDVIMPRSLMPALAVLAAGGRKLGPLLFDADGLAADERVDVAGLSPTGATYRMLRDIEAQMVRVSTAILTRTQRAAEILHHRAGPPVSLASFHVVANGRDEGVFHPFEERARAETRRRLGVAEGSPLLAYAGSVGPQYRLESMKSLLGEVRRLRPDARLLLMTGSPELAAEAMADQSSAAIVIRAEPSEVPRYLAAADVGLAYRSTSFSMQAVAPVKLSEYLLCGLPVIGTGAIGDTSAVIGEGLFFDDEAGSAAAAGWLVDEVLPRREAYRARARAAGQAQFSLRRSVDDYARALARFRS